MNKSVEDLKSELIIAQKDYQDNSGSDRADEFYYDYVSAYNAYWFQVDPSKVVFPGSNI